MWGYTGRSLAWLAASSVLLVGGFLLLGAGLVGAGVIRVGTEPGTMQVMVLQLLVQTIVLQALLPHLLLTFAGWLVLVRLAPSLERSWLGLLGGLPVLAVLCFPLVARLSFHIWNPSGLADYVYTLLLTGGGVSISLLLPRRVIRWLRPGCFVQDSGPAG